MVVSAVVLGGELALAIDRATELTAPDDQRVFEQSTLLEIADQRGGRLIGVATLTADRLRQVEMLIPAAMEELNEPHAPLGQSPSQQAVGGECAGLASVRAVQVEDVFRFARHVGQFGDPYVHDGFRFS